tara:strand:+ start:181 stop:1470 length:1290 start_codon:yes stop_codon:yes gene_type:complete
MKFLFSDTAQISIEKMKEKATELSSYISYLQHVCDEGAYACNESSICLPTDKLILEQSQNFVTEKKTDTLKYIFLVGIGGSSLGTKAFYDAARYFPDMFEDYVPKMFFIDTVNPLFLHHVVTFIQKHVHKPTEFLLIISSKSGKTTETITNAELLLNAFSEKFSKADIYNRTISICDSDSQLAQVARQKGIVTASIPKSVGGRFSVFSTVGVIPLLFIGMDMKAVLSKARHAQKECLDEDVLKNPALASAIILYETMQQGIKIHDTFFFNSEYESIGKWYKQLQAESLGKKGEYGNIMPTISVGSTDLHSLAQLYLGGENARITTFVWQKPLARQVLPKEEALNILDELSCKSSVDILTAIYDGTKKVYKNQGLPFTEVVLSGFSDIGAFMQFKMMETMYLAKLLGVDAFSQPEVELYKKETRDILDSL